MTKVIIDTDPGTDDALAIMMALNSSDLDVVGLTTVGGNATLEHTTENALALLDHLGVSGVTVSPGAAGPLEGGFENAYHVHGSGGLGVDLPAPTSKAHGVEAAELITEAASKYRGELVIVAIGPLTNLAEALRAEPRMVRWVAEIVVMGGAVEVPGNVTPHAEFNVYNDALAADIVLNSGIAVTLVGLDVTRQTSVTAADLPWVVGEAPTARLARRIVTSRLESRPEGGEYHLHDPLAVVAALQPELLEYRQATVTVHRQGDERGRTVARYGDGPVKVAVRVDVGGAKALIKRLLEAKPPQR